MKSIKRNEAMAYHVLPPYGLLNDPNGLVFFKGITHVFFQWNLHETTHSYKAWGHAVTKDLIHFDYLEPALLPEEAYEKNGCYSGSAIIHEDLLYLFYTGNVKDGEGNRESYQCLAVSEDGFTFEKKGPVISEIPGYTAHVRDPKIFKEKDTFYMVLGAQRDDLTGDTVLFKSKDLYSWEFVGSLLEDKVDLGYMWECPDLIHFKEKSAFIVSPQGLEPKGEKYRNIYQTGYFTGEFEKEHFKPDHKPFRELDFGFEFYAPQSFAYKEGRTLLLGWMGVMEPGLESSLPTIKNNWAHHLTLFRELSLNEAGNLIQKPVKELEAYRVPLEEVEGYDYQGTYEEPLEIRGSFKKAPDEFTLRYGKNLTLVYEQSKRSFRVERENWETKTKEYRMTTLTRDLQDIQIYLDHTSMEIFLNGGEEVFSLRYFEGEGKKEVIMTSSGEMRINIDHLEV